MCRSAEDLLVCTHLCMVHLVYSDSNAYLDSKGEEGGKEWAEGGGGEERKGGEGKGGRRGVGREEQRGQRGRMLRSR